MHRSVVYRPTDFATKHVLKTAAEVMSKLSAHPGSYIVLMDNLKVHVKGQQFLEKLRREPGLRARTRSICMAVRFNCEWARQAYGDVLDAYLDCRSRSLICSRR